MSAENCSSKAVTAPLLKWNLIHEESDDEHSSQAELNQTNPNDDDDRGPHPSQYDSDSTLSRDEFSTDVIPASFSNLNITNGHIGILQTDHRPNKEFLEEVESISSDLTDSLIISPKTNSAYNSQESEFQNWEPISQQKSRCSVKRNQPISTIFFHKRRKIDESQEFNYGQSIKQNCNTYANIDALLRKLKHPDKLSLKDRKRATSKMRHALTDIRNETESMLQGMIPVPNKMHIKMQLMRSRKLCDHLIAFYEDFPSNSQKMLLEEVSQVQETIQCELKGILELLNYSETSAKRLIHQRNNTDSSESDVIGTYPTSSDPTKQLHMKEREEKIHRDENKNNTLLEEQADTVFSKSFQCVKQNIQNDFEENIPVRDSCIEITDLSISPLSVENQTDIKLTSDSSMKKIKTCSNSSQSKKRVHFKLQPDILQNMTTNNDLPVLKHTQNQNKNAGSANIDRNSVTKDSTIGVSDEILTQSNCSYSQTMLKNVYETPLSKTQNPFNHSVEIPENCLHVQPEQIFIPLHHENSSNFSPFKSQSSSLNRPNFRENSDSFNRSQKPADVLIEEGNKNQNVALSSSSAKSFSCYDYSKQGLQNLHSAPDSHSHEHSHTCQTSLFSNSQSSQMTSTSKKSDINRMLKYNVFRTLTVPQSPILKQSHKSKVPSSKTIENSSQRVNSMKPCHESVNSQEKSQHSDRKNKQTNNVGNAITHYSEAVTGKEQQRNTFGSASITQNSLNILQHITPTSIPPQHTSKNTINYINFPPSPSCSMPPSQDLLFSSFSDQINTPNTAVQSSNEHLPTTHQYYRTQMSQTHKIHNPTSRNATITSNESLKQNEEWLHIKPPKLPWQMGETLPESHMPDFPKLPCSLLVPLKEFKKFKIPKLPWEDNK